VLPDEFSSNSSITGCRENTERLENYNWLLIITIKAMSILSKLFVIVFTNLHKDINTKFVEDNETHS